MRHIENFNRFYAEICKTEVSASFFSVAVTVFSRQKSHAKNQINLRMHYMAYIAFLFFEVRLYRYNAH